MLIAYVLLLGHGWFSPQISSYLPESAGHRALGAFASSPGVEGILLEVFLASIVVFEPYRRRRLGALRCGARVERNFRLACSRVERPEAGPRSASRVGERFLAFGHRRDVEACQEFPDRLVL